MYTQMMKDAQDRAAAIRRDAFMADLRKRGILKEKTDDGTVGRPAPPPEDDSFPWLMLVGFVLGLLAVIGLLSWLVIFLVMRFAEVSASNDVAC